MMKKITFILAICISFSSMAQVLPNLGGQRAGLSAMSFLKNDINPRSLAMGGASVAISGDGYAAFTNPAFIADMKAFNLTTSSYFVGAGINQGYLSAILPSKENPQAFALSVNTLGSGSMEVRTEFQPNGTGQKVSANYISGGFSYARRLSDMFTIGVTAHVIHEQLAEYKNTTVTADLGFAYQTDWKKLAFAVMLQNFGGNSSLSGDFLEVNFNRNVTNIGLENYTVPTVFKLGASFVPYEKERQSLRLAFDLNHPNDNAENFRLGAEYEYLKLLFLRAGYRFNVAGQTFPTMGLGVRSRIGGHPLKIDYGVNITNYMGTQHVVGLSFTLNNDKR